MQVSTVLSSTPGESIGAGMLLLLVLLALSSPIAYGGWKNKQRYHELSAISDDLAAATPGECVSVSGTISRRSQQVRSPYQSQSCAVALWDIAQFSGDRRGWETKAIGIIAGELQLITDDGQVVVSGLSREKTLTTTEMIKRPLTTDASSAIASVQIELGRSSTERRFRPSQEPPEPYRTQAKTAGIDIPIAEPPGRLKRVLSTLRTPADTSRYRKSVFQSGDQMTIVGKKTETGLSFESADSVQPIVSSRPLPALRKKYRFYGAVQLYGIPAVCVVLAALAAYGAYL